jgi:hypothetical protein
VAALTLTINARSCKQIIVPMIQVWRIFVLADVKLRLMEDGYLIYRQFHLELDAANLSRPDLDNNSDHYPAITDPKNYYCATPAHRVNRSAAVRSLVHFQSDT